MTQHHPKSHLFSNVCEKCGSKPESGKNHMIICVVCNRKVCPECAKGHLCKTHYNKLPKIAKRKLKKLEKSNKNNQRFAFSLTGLFSMIAIIILLVADFNSLLLLIFVSAIITAMISVKAIAEHRFRSQVRREYIYHFPVKITKKDLLLNIVG
jgi:hypothetical protein